LFLGWYRRVSNDTQQYPESWKELEKYSKSFPKYDRDKKYLPKAGAIGERLHSTKCFCTWTHVKKHHDNKHKINLFFMSFKVMDN
jgi:hypothetical protein